jgi:hypothetical protein
MVFQARPPLKWPYKYFDSILASTGGTSTLDIFLIMM